MNTLKICATCRWKTCGACRFYELYADDSLECCCECDNESSQNWAEFTSQEDTCEAWEEKDG